jgi:YidC/Oxa1 family membrane protein insertase
MDKRLPLAMLLSLAVWFLWIRMNPLPVPETQETGAGTAIEAPADPVVASDPRAELSDGARSVAAEAEQLTVILRTPGPAQGEFGPRGLWQATFDNKGGVLRELRTGHYKDSVDDEDVNDPEHWPVLLTGVETLSEGFAGETGSLLLAADVSSRDLIVRPLSEELWDMQLLGPADAPTGVVFRLSPGRGVSFEKRFEVATKSASGWEFDLTLTVSNTAEPGVIAAGPRQFRFTPAANVPPALDDPFYVEPRAVAAGPFGSDDIEEDTAEMRAKGANLKGPLEVAGPLSFVGSHNKYFAFLMRGADSAATRSMAGASFERLAEKGTVETKWVNGRALLELSVPAAGESKSYHYRVFAGPKEQHILSADSPDFLLVTEKDLNWFSGIGKLLLSFLNFLEKYTGNFGWAIVIMTLCIRAIMFPMTRKSQTAMSRYQKKMQRVQPKINAIKEKYKDDRQALAREQQKLMQEEGIFPPLGGCLPLFIQMPIFFGLFSALRTSFDLRQAPFMGYIQDLSRPDALFPLSFDIPVLHWETFNLLPIIMVVMWILQQATMPKPTDPQSARMQKMMMFMPVMMGFFLYNYAAGLSLYMITQSTVGIIEQKVIKKIWPINEAEVETKKRGCGPFSGMMERLAEKQKQQMAMMEKQRALQAQQRAKTKKKRK